MVVKNVSPSSIEANENCCVKLSTLNNAEEYHLDDDDRCSSENNIQDEIYPQKSHDHDTIHTLSGLYAEILIVVVGATVLAELLHGSMPLFYIHDYLFMYLLGLGILLVIGVYSIKFHYQTSQDQEENEEKVQNLTKQSLQDKWIVDINIFFKVGVVVFGLVAVFTSFLEIMSIFSSTEKCISFASASQPVLRCVFILIQIYFLKNAKEILNILGCMQSLAIMHLFATNVSIWLRHLLWESAKDWDGALHLKHNSSVDWHNSNLNITVHSLESDAHSPNISYHYPKHVVHYTTICYWQVKKSEEFDVISLQHCLQNSTVGLLWEKLNQFLYPLMTQYYFLICCILYIIWINNNAKKTKPNFSLYQSKNANVECKCSRSTKGLFLGSVIFTASLIVLILFFAVDKSLNLMLHSIYCVIFVSSSFSAALGLFQVKKMYTWKSKKDIHFIRLYQQLGLFAVYIYGSCNVIAGCLSHDKLSFIAAVEAVSMIIQCTVQYLFIVQVSRKKTDVSNVQQKPGRQAVAFLIFCNVSLWMLECFVTWNHIRQYYHITFGDTLWPVVTRCTLPFVVFYRYHSFITLIDVWGKTYQ